MVNVFSFCLYGPPNPRYYPNPILENIYLIGTYFTDWKVMIYVAPDVDIHFVKQMSDFSNVVIRHTGVTGPENMIHRFYAIDEPDVDTMMVRDADSRVHWRDRWAIRDFMKNPRFTAHTIRDNVEHTSKLMGGLWGLRKSSGVNMKDNYEYYKAHPWQEPGGGWGHDQDFLSHVIYPKIVKYMLVHHCKGRIRLGETGKEFPFEWSNACYCGRVEDETFRDSADRVEIKEPQQPPYSFLNKK